MGSNSKGSRNERRVARYFDQAGYMVMRSPSSGGGTTREQPDIFAARDGERLALEAKYEGSRDGRVYLTSEELDGLRTFADTVLGLPLVAVRWSYDRAWYLFRIGDLDDVEGDGDNKVATRELAERAPVVLCDRLEGESSGGGHGFTYNAIGEVGIDPADFAEGDL